MTTELEPQYFTEFRRELKADLDRRFNKIEEKLDGHAEQIAEVSEQVVELQTEFGKMKIDINIMKGDIVEMKVDIANMKSDINEVKGDLKHKANQNDIVPTIKRVFKLKNKPA